MTFHLSHEQLCDLLLDTSSIDRSSIDAPGQPEPNTSTLAARRHLASCSACQSSLASLQQPLALFAQAATALAEQQYLRPALPQPLALHTSDRTSHRSYHRSSHRSAPLLSSPLFWAAAVLLLCASILPFTLHRSPSSPAPQAAVHATQPSPELSDEALLDQVNQDLDSSIPAPMRALADPTLNQRSASSTTSTERTN